jgi:hypothetical protein
MSNFKGWNKPKPRAHKYGAVPKVVDGIRFDSTAEADFYVKIRPLEKTGVTIERQVNFSLSVNGVKITTYRADFILRWPDGTVEVYDVKGYRTREYEIKRKLMYACLGIDIIEVGAEKKVLAKSKTRLNL